MNEQINLRMPAKLAGAARKKAKEQGYGSVQEYIEAAVREKTFDDLTERELAVVLRLAELAKNPTNLVSKEEFYKKLRKNGKLSENT